MSQTFLAFSLSTDAFAVALVKGTSLKQKNIVKALKIGLLFGVVEMTTPVIGWLIGKSMSDWVAAVDHWLIFAILAGIGCHILYEAFFDSKDDSLGMPKEIPEKDVPFLKMFLLSIATSIDGLAVGTSMAFLQIHILKMSALIGITTFLMVSLGVMIGGKISQKWGIYAEIFGGLCLIILGTLILGEHLGYFPMILF